MNQENLHYLKENVKYMGFGEKLYPELEQEIAKGNPQFQLQIETEINGKAFAAMLNFRRSDTTDLYFFNSYHATLQRRDGEIVDQAFYVNKGKGVTAKEAFNLLDGRAVHKELTTKRGEPFTAWIQLDFDKKDKNNNHEVKQFHESYGYNLKEALARYNIAELNDPTKLEALLKSLQKGNLQAISPEGSATRMFVEAAPQYKSLTFYDNDMKRLPAESLSQYQRASHAAQNREEMGGPAKAAGEGKKGGKQVGQDKPLPVAEKGVKAKDSTKKTVDGLLPKEGTPKKSKGVKIR